MFIVSNVAAMDVDAARLEKRENWNPSVGPVVSRRTLLARGIYSAAMAVCGGVGSTVGARAQGEGGSEAEVGKTTQGFETQSGLRFWDFRVGTGDRTPSWGDQVIFSFIIYVVDRETGDLLRVADSQSISSRGWVIRHGNGQTIRGVEESLHTMKVGGRRRAVIPPALGYIGPGLGPTLPTPRDRKRLARAVEKGGGILVFDLELLDIAPLPDKEGYYTEPTPTMEELGKMFEELRKEHANDVGHPNGPAVPAPQ
mmetsp:Transcript_11815/g.24086  ORF Transcript_11815/g.24086 Transcript_11815/m.24086 type:complete len:255 (+) Transcript_11815:666-1430(+)